MLLNFPKIQLIQSHQAYRMIILKKNQIKKIKIKKNYLYFKPQQEIKMKCKLKKIFISKFNIFFCLFFKIYVFVNNYIYADLNKIMKKIKKNMNPYQKIKNKILRIALF